MTSSHDYLRLLTEQRPEALILLAYYAVILHRRRRSWIIGDAGRLLITAISSHLGRHWQPLLEWPRQQVVLAP